MTGADMLKGHQLLQGKRGGVRGSERLQRKKMVKEVRCSTASSPGLR